MKKASAVGKRFGLHPDTVRNWTKQFAEFFSPEANAANELQRHYTSDDEVIINTIHTLRQQRMEFEEVRARLAAGERMSTLPVTQEPVSPETQLAVYAELREIKTLLGDRDREIERLRAEGKEKDERMAQLREEMAVMRYRLKQLGEVDDL